MKKFITNLLICLALCVTTPGAFADNGNAGGAGNGQNGNGNAFGLKESDPAVIESAAQSISVVIAAEAGGDNERYLKYARKLAQTLDQKSSAELDRILQSGNHFGLGN